MTYMKILITILIAFFGGGLIGLVFSILFPDNIVASFLGIVLSAIWGYSITQIIYMYNR